MNCDRVQQLLDELPGPELADLDAPVREHVETCRSCGHALKLRLLAAESLARSKGTVAAGAQLRSRLIAAIDREAASTAPPRTNAVPGEKPPFWRAVFRPSPVWAAVALLLFLLSGYNYMRTLGYFSPAGEKPATMATFVHDVGHDAYLYTRETQTLEIASGDPAVIREWFAPRLDFPVEAPADLPDGFVLQGARLWHTVSRLSAYLSYKCDSGEKIALFAISARNLADTGAREVTRGDRLYHTGESFQYNVVSWQQDDTAWALVGRIPVDSLLEIAGGCSP